MNWLIIFCSCIFAQGDVVSSEHPKRFPIKRLLGLNGKIKISLSKYLCSDRGTFRYEQYCDCYESCIKSKTCCIDYLWDRFPLLELHTYLKTFANITKKYKDLSCEHILPPLMFGSDSEKLLMVKSCTNSNNSLRCLNETDTSLEAQFPVFGEDNYLYRNKFCAQCNSVNYNLVPPGRQGGPDRRFGLNLRDLGLYISAQCKEVLYIISSLNGKLSTNELEKTFRKCYYSIDRHDGMQPYLHSCYNNTCNHGNDIYNLCRSYAAPMLNYQNYHCYKCNKNASILSSLNLVNSIKSDRNSFKRKLSVPKDKLNYPWTFKLSLNGNNMVEVTDIERVFPLLESFNLSHTYNIEYGEVITKYSCTSQDIHRRQCSCSSDCMKYKACCIDVFWDATNPMRLQLYIEMFLNESKKYKDLSCEYILPPDVNKDGDMERIFMVNSCLYDRNATRCLNETDTSLGAIFPVFGEDNYLYRSRYCAECNGLNPIARTSSRRLTFRYSVKCKVSITINKSLTGTASIDELKNVFKDCLYLIDQSDSIVKQYLHSCHNNTCHPKDKLYDLCHSYKAPEMNHQNRHCRECNISSKHANKCPSGRCDFISPQNKFVYPLSYIIQLNDDNVIEVKDKRQQFPLLEFFGISQDNEIVNDDKNLEKYLCVCERCQGCCNCADDCMESHTCCIDKLWNPSKPTSLQSYLNMFMEKLKEYRQQVCEYVLPYVINQGHNSRMYMMTRSCKKGAKINDITNCLNNHNNSLDLLIPVFGTDKYLYRNKYCALCNFIKNFTYVDIRGDCEERLQSEIPLNETIIATKYFAKCLFKITDDFPQSEFIKYCPEPIKWNKHCDKSNINYNLCNMYTGKINGYANYHCMKCNSGGPLKLEDSDCLTKALFWEPPLVSWSLLISPTGFNILQGNNPETNVMRFEPDIYVVIDSNVVILSFDNCLQTRNLTFVISYGNNKSYVMYFINQFRSQLHMFGLNTSMYYQGKTIFISLKDSKYLSIETLSKFISTYQDSNESIFQHVDSFMLNSIKDYQVSSPYNWDIYRLYPGGKPCAESVRWTENCDSTTKCDIFCDGTFINQSNIYMWVEFRQKYAIRNLLTCDRFYLHSQCTLKKLSANDFQVNESKYLVHKEDKTKVYPVEQYIPLQNGFGTCILSIDDYPRWMKLLLIVEGYISFICTSISICCYVVVIVTFYAYRQLRNAGGLAGLSMCSCLLVTDSLYLTINVIYKTSGNIFELCATVGIMMHYGLLTAHMWSVLIAFDIASTFHGLNVKQRGIKRFYKTCAVAFVVPLLIIVLCIILNFNDILYFGYGDGNICFIVGFAARLVFYIIPVACIWLMNIILLVYSIIQITRKKKGNDAALGKSNRANVNITSIAVRLIILFGMSEVFGFINIPNANHNEAKIIFNSIFSFLYTLLRSARGFILLIVYICRRQVFLLYKGGKKTNINQTEQLEMKRVR